MVTLLLNLTVSPAGENQKNNYPFRLTDQAIFIILLTQLLQCTALKIFNLNLPWRNTGVQLTTALSAQHI